MTCQCICKCKCQNEANDTQEPKLCMACSLMDALMSPRHGLPYTPPPTVKLDPLEPITDAQKDAALQNWVAENGF